MELAVVGKSVWRTALTANLAAALAEQLRQSGKRAVIAADFDIVHGDLAKFCGISHEVDEGTLDALVSDNPQNVLESALVDVGDGFWLLPSRDAMRRAGVVPGSAAVQRTVRLLSGMCTLLIVDVCDVLANVVLPACSHAIISVDDTPSSARAGEQLARYCSAAGTRVVGYVINRLHSHSAPRYVKLSGLRLLAELPHDCTVEEYYGRRLPLRDAPGSPHVREVRRLAELLVKTPQTRRQLL